MWYIVNALVLAAIVGGGVSLLAALAGMLRRQNAWAEFFWSATLLRRGLIFTLVTALLGISLHLGMLHTHFIQRDLPSMVLAWDVAHERYGPIAMGELTERSMNQTLDEDRAQSITDTLLEVDWWESRANVTPFPRTDPVQDWFALQLEKGRITDAQLAQWLNRVRPMIFSIESSTDAWSVRSEYGRSWQRAMNTPYRIDRIEIESIQINGEPVEFTTVEADDSEAEFGWMATKAIFHHLLPMQARRNGEENTIEVTYRLDLEPGSYGDVGPLHWTGVVIPN